MPHTDREIQEMHHWALALSTEYDALANAPWILEEIDIDRMQSVYESFMVLQGLVKQHLASRDTPHPTLQVMK